MKILSVCVCVYSRDEGSVFGLGSFPPVPVPSAQNAVIHTGFSGPEARVLDPLNTHPPALHGNTLLHPEGQRQMVVIQRARPPGITGDHVMSPFQAHACFVSPLFPSSISISFTSSPSPPPHLSLTPESRHMVSTVYFKGRLLRGHFMCEGTSTRISWETTEGRSRLPVCVCVQRSAEGLSLLTANTGLRSFCEVIKGQQGL